MKKFVFFISILFIGISLIPIINENIKAHNLIEKVVILDKYESEFMRGFVPNEDWNKTFGGLESDRGDCIQQTSDGGYIVTGCTVSYGNGNGDVWLIKTDENGSEEWANTYGGSGHDYGLSVQQTTDNGYILTGGTTSYGAGSRDIWLIKTDENGNEEWSKTFGGENFESGESVQQTIDGGYFITGITLSFGNGYSDVWLIKTDSNGNMEWNNTIGGFHYDYGWSGIQSSDGGYVIVGRTESYGAGHGDFWIIKTDGQGFEIWDETYGTNGYESAHSVQETTEGGYIIAGFTNSYGAGWYDVWLIKMSSVGSKEWERTFGGLGGDTCSSVYQTSDGGFIIAGGTYSYGEGDSDVWLIRTDMVGEEKWNKTFGGENYDYAESVQQTTDGGFILTGRTSSFGSGDNDIWLLKIERDNNPPYKPSDPNPENNSKSVDINVNLSWYCSDPEGDNITFDVYFGDSNPPKKIIENQSSDIYDPGTLQLDTKYFWQIIAWTNNTPCTKGPIWCFTTNYKPKKPDIDGPISGSIGVPYKYVFNSVDIDGENIYYYIEWGDGHVEIWDGPHLSGEDFEITHTFVRQGTNIIQAKAKDINGFESEITTFEVTIPKLRYSINLPIFRYINYFPNLDIMLKYFMEHYLKN